MRLESPTTSDYVACLKINRACFEGEERAPDGIFFNAWETGNIFVTRVEDRVVGFAIVTKQNGMPYLWVIAVTPDFRGQGIASTLLYEIWQDYKSMNYRTIDLTVKTTNPAQKLYFDAGYRVVKFLRNYYIGGGDGLLMRRKI